MENTYRFYIYKLPQEVREKVLKYCNDKILDEEFCLGVEEHHRPSMSISAVIIFKDTDEGSDYWLDLRNKLYEKEKARVS